MQVFLDALKIVETLTDLLYGKFLISELKYASFFQLDLFACHQRSPYFCLGIELSLDNDLIDLSFLIVVELVLSFCEFASR